MYLVICCCRRCCKVDQTKEFCTADRYVIKRLHFGSLERADINLGLNIKYAFRAFSFFIFIFRPETPKEYLRQKIVLTYQGVSAQLCSMLDTSWIFWCTRGGGVGGKEKVRGVCRLGEVGVHE